MAIEIAWDKVNGAQAMISARQGDRVMLIGRATGLTNANTTPRGALIDAIKQAFPAGSSPIPPQYPHDDINATLSYITADGETQTSAIIRAFYEPPTFGGAPVEKFAIEDVTNLVNDPTQLDPTTGVPLLCSLIDEAPDITKASTKVVTINFPQTWNVLALYGLFASKPSAAIKNLKKKVNDATWQGKPKGYWRCEGPRARWSSRDSLYAVSVTVVSRDDRDWSAYSIAEKDGEFVRVDPAVMAPLWAEAYQPGIRYQKNGILKDGPYLTANFGTALDPLIDDTPLSAGGGFDNLSGV